MRMHARMRNITCVAQFEARRPNAVRMHARRLSVCVARDERYGTREAVELYLSTRMHAHRLSVCGCRLCVTRMRASEGRTSARAATLRHLRVRRHRRCSTSRGPAAPG